MLEISVLGPLELRRDGEPVTVPGGKTAELLVRLALSAGAHVRADRLLDELWAATPTNRNTLQQKVARLRRSLGDSARIESADDGYRLAVDPESVDALHALRVADAAAALLDTSDHRRAADTGAAGLALFRGDPLPGAGDWAEPHRTRLEDARSRLLETTLAARLELQEDVVGELEEAVATAPYRERLWELLVTALYRAGRQADALSALRRVRALLVGDLGLEPGPRLREIERQILTQDARLEPRAGNLPSLAAGLVAREQELEDVRALLGQHRLVEILGTGGIGKTALAIEAARTLTDHTIWLVRLEVAQSDDQVLDTVLSALGVVGGEPALHDRLRRNDILLILDNCEHVIDAVVALSEQLLDVVPSLRILCTSQTPLELPGTATLELQPLDLDAAVDLFTQRAQRTGDLGQTRDLCRALDGLPLAIELAAARTRTLPLHEIARRLDDRFAVLSDPASRKPERRRALRATIGWSYELLFPDDQRGLWALATFPGGAALDAAESVLQAFDVPAAAAIDVIGRLAGRSLVIVDDAPRYRLLDSIRAYAIEAMTEAGQAERGLAAQADWYACQADISTAGVRGTDQARFLALARTERANIEAALTWLARHDPVRALELAEGFGWAWIVLGDARGADRLLAAARDAGGTATAHRQASALLLAAWIEASSGHLEPARHHVEEAETLAGAEPDIAGRAAYTLAYIISHAGAWQQAIELTDRARAVLDPLDRPWDQAANALFASRAAISAGDLELARRARDDVDHWLTIVDDPWLHARRDAMLGELARVERRFDDAVAHIAKAAETSGRLGFLQTEAYQLTSLGRAQCQAGDYEDGATTLRLGIDKAAAAGDVRLAALGRVHLGRILRALGRPDEARQALRDAATFHRSAGGGEQQLLGDTLLAALEKDERALSELLGRARAAGDAPAEVFALDALATLTHESSLTALADERMRDASHFIAERDRVDRHAARPT